MLSVLQTFKDVIFLFLHFLIEFLRRLLKVLPSITPREQRLYYQFPFYIHMVANRKTGNVEYLSPVFFTEFNCKEEGFSVEYLPPVFLTL